MPRPGLDGEFARRFLLAPVGYARWRGGLCHAPMPFGTTPSADTNASALYTCSTGARHLQQLRRAHRGVLRTSTLGCLIDSKQAEHLCPVPRLVSCWARTQEQMRQGAKMLHCLDHDCSPSRLQNSSSAYLRQQPHLLSNIHSINVSNRRTTTVLERIMK